MSVVPAAYPSASVWSLRRVRQNPIAFLENLAAGGDLVECRLAGRTAILLNHPDFVQDVLVTHHARFAKPSAVQRARALFGNGLFTAEAPLHQQRRRALNPGFSAARLVDYSRIVSDEIARLDARWHDGQIVDIASEMQQLTLKIIGRILFGADLSKDAAEIGRALAVGSASIDPLLALLAPSRRLKPAARLLRNLVARLIEQHAASAGEGDMLTLLRQQGDEDAGQLHDDLVTLLVAGHDTIANGLIWTWHLLADHPEAAARLHDELATALEDRTPAYDDLKNLPYAGAVFAESLRLYPPAWVITRRALVDHRIGSQSIPAGAIVIVSQFLLHRDARFFHDPLSFRPERWTEAGRAGGAGRVAGAAARAYFPFGMGPRACIGEGLATLEGVLVVAGLAARWTITPHSPIAFDPRATLRPAGPIPATLNRR